jgi:hypothetical protein
MMRVMIAATVVEMADGGLALLVEMEPDPGLGPPVVDPLGDVSASADPGDIEQQRSARGRGLSTLHRWAGPAATPTAKRSPDCEQTA